MTNIITLKTDTSLTGMLSDAATDAKAGSLEGAILIRADQYGVLSYDIQGAMPSSESALYQLEGMCRDIERHFRRVREDIEAFL